MTNRAKPAPPAGPRCEAHFWADKPDTRCQYDADHIHDTPV